MTSGRRNFEDSAKLWDKGGIQPKPPKREARAGYWLTDGQALYPTSGRKRGRRQRSRSSPSRSWRGAFCLTRTVAA